MKPVSAFRDIAGSPAADPVRVLFDGAPLTLPDGANLAAALLAAGVTVTRHLPATGAPRGPYCMMGACFDCLVDIDGVTVQACMIPVRAGMVIRRPAAGEVSDAAL